MIRKLWGASTSEQESRASLQTRLTAFSKLVFWAFVALLAFLKLMYGLYDNAPDGQSLIWAISMISITVLAVAWRGLLVPRQLAFEMLYHIDTFYMFANAPTTMRVDLQQREHGQT